MEGQIDSRSHPGQHCRIPPKPLFYSMKAGYKKQLGAGGSQDSWSMGGGGGGGGYNVIERLESYTTFFSVCNKTGNNHLINIKS